MRGGAQSGFAAHFRAFLFNEKREVQNAKALFGEAVGDGDFAAFRGADLWHWRFRSCLFFVAPLPTQLPAKSGTYAANQIPLPLPEYIPEDYLIHPLDLRSGYSV